jgi:hypothetical protein
VAVRGEELPAASRGPDTCGRSVAEAGTMFGSLASSRGAALLAPSSAPIRAGMSQ